jgi:hypothetical protein
MNPIGAISDLVGKVIDKAFPDKDEANRIKAGIDAQLINMDLEQLKAATSIITAEAGGESWLQRNWRPVTMLTFVALVVAHWLGWTAPNLSEEQVLKLLNIVQVGLGGYVVSRGVEKTAKIWRQS